MLILCNWGQVKGTVVGEAETTMTSDSAKANQRGSMIQDEKSSGSHEQIVIKPGQSGGE